MLYDGLYIKVVSILAILYCLFSAVSFLIYPNKIFNSDSYILGVLVCFAAILTPLLTLYNANRGFRTNKTLQETITTTFTEQDISPKGETFTTSFKWDKLYQVKIIDCWLLLYQSKAVANFVKFGPEDESNIEALKSLIIKSGLKIKYKW